MKFTHDILKVSEDLDEIVELISDISMSEKVFLHFFDDNKFSLVSAIGAPDDLKSDLSGILSQVFEEGELASVFNVKGLKHHCLGIPIFSNTHQLIGVLSLMSQNKLNLDRKQNKTLKVFLKSILFVFEKEQLLLYKRSCLNQMLEINNGFYFKVGIDSVISDIGPNFKTSLPSLKSGDILTDSIIFEQHFDIKSQFDLEEFKNQIYFFTDIHDKQRYKFSFLIFENEMIISASPVINTKYTLRNYHLVLNDFSKHDYIAEYMFLQQTSEKSLKEARVISDNLVKRNVELKQAQRKIGELSKFPSENPNPILRFSTDLELVYNNPASL
ncbi:hypothetical protein N9H88_00570, partial [bacterium]|nr:hypothetical protein [bacterium]MDA9020521.1 hypothetical protein [bacterium]